MSLRPDATLPPKRRLDALERHAMTWVRRMASGEMTHADGEALREWARRDPSHAKALANARRQWQHLMQAAHQSASAAAVCPASAQQPIPQRKAGHGFDPRRRWWLAGTAGAFATAAGIAAMGGPLGLFQGAAALHADYRTGTGEQRTVALAGNVSVEMSTRTSLALRAGSTPGIDLLGGEAAVDTTRTAAPFEIVAGAGRTIAHRARVEVRNVAQRVCVTCIDGVADVVHTAGRVQLRARQQLVYDEHALQSLVNVGDGEMPAWRDGYLRFAEVPLGEVIDEINRYRPGKVVLMNDKLAARPVTGRFAIRSLDVALGQIEHSLQLSAHTLPGGIVLLG
ncbi:MULTISPECIES: FecR family protein [Pandoraea]|uniref:Fe2+-dicitrate sensor, membrane protein n=1 Tax=Pandoraea communis TaxID=2508297 RepID=A0A5E4Z7E2_9BURK|nr:MULTISPECIES: FecR domain-containing protein [Pandoraea]EON10603.1 Fe2+-dicitrate sensor, membrane protein [Pandoraea sp. SD6-2]VVE56345.1 Fe2+-dicitrate sensor, membrane protein [Pandoraea communis]